MPKTFIIADTQLGEDGEPTYTKVLKEYGYDLHLAHDLDSISETLRNHRTDVLIFAEGVLGSIAQSKHAMRTFRSVSPSTKAVILVDQVNTNDIKQLLRAGIWGYMVRPFEPLDMIDEMQVLLPE